MFGRFGGVAQDGLVNFTAVTADDIKLPFPKSAADQSDHARAQNDDRKRNMKKENRGESESGERPHNFVSKRFAPDANDGDSDNRHDGRLQSVKDRRDPREIAERGINVTQPPE